jgi:hypothetical protein
VTTHDHHHRILAQAATRERLVHHLASEHRSEDGQYKAIVGLHDMTLEELHEAHVQAHKESNQ